MRHLALFAAFLVPLPGLADQTMDMSHMDHAAMMAMMGGAPSGVTEAGQSAFAAIAEIVAVLQADPTTDWSRVNIEALRQHLIDMDNVTLRAIVAAAPSETGASFTVTSPDATVQASIRRMVADHAKMMTGTNGWTMTVADVAGGVVLTVSGSAADVAEINGLGFIGIMVLGMHHQAHHLAIAKGQDPVP